MHKKLTAIIVDDEPTARAILLRHLRQIPLVEVLGDFKNAIDIFNKYNIFNECKKKTEGFISKSIMCLEKLPDTKIKNHLVGLANESIERSK